MRCDAMRCDANIMVALKKKIFSKYTIMVALKKKIFSKYTKYLGQTIVIKRLCQEKLEIYVKFIFPSTG